MNYGRKYNLICNNLIGRMIFMRLKEMDMLDIKKE
jgi:hypothetical protein